MVVHFRRLIQNLYCHTEASPRDCDFVTIRRNWAWPIGFGNLKKERWICVLESLWCALVIYLFILQTDIWTIFFRGLGLTVPTCVNPAGRRALFSTRKVIMAHIPSFLQVALTKVHERDLAIRVSWPEILKFKGVQQEGQRKWRNCSLWMQQ